MLAERNFAQKRFYIQQLSHREPFAPTSFNTQGNLCITHRCLCTHTQISLTDAFRQRSRYREQLLHRAAFAHRRLCTKKLVCPNAFTHEDTEAFTHRGFHTEAFDLVKSHFFSSFISIVTVVNNPSSCGQETRSKHPAVLMGQRETIPTTSVVQKTWAAK